MMEITEMQTMLESLVHDSALDRLFKPGRIKIQDKKLPHSVSMRLKLHNPYGFLEFSVIEKKTGLKFCIKYLKTIPVILRKYMLSLGGAFSNSNTYVGFPFGTCDSGQSYEDILKTLRSLYSELMTFQMIAACGAEEYKPVKILQAELANAAVKKVLIAE